MEVTDRAADESVAELLIGDEAMPRFCRTHVQEAEGRRIRAGIEACFGASLQHGHEDGPRGAGRFELGVEFGVVAESGLDQAQDGRVAVGFNVIIGPARAKVFLRLPNLDLLGEFHSWSPAYGE